MSKINILSNPAMPGLIMINSSEIQKDASSLNPGVPEPFVVEFSADVQDLNKIMSELKQTFEAQQPNPKRAFFKIPTETAVAKLQELAEQEDYARKQAVLKEREVQQNRAPVSQRPKTLEEMVAAAGGTNFRQSKKNNTIFDNEKIKTVAGWTVAIVFIFFIMMLGASDGGRNDDMYENSRQIRR